MDLASVPPTGKWNQGKDNQGKKRGDVAHHPFNQY